MLALVNCWWENADGMLRLVQDCVAVAVIPATTTVLFCYWYA